MRKETKEFMLKLSLFLGILYGTLGAVFIPFGAVGYVFIGLFIGCLATFFGVVISEK